MVRTPIPEADSSAAVVVGPLRDSFLRHLAAENRSRSTQVTYAAAIDLLAAFVADSGMPSVTELRREHIEAFLVDLRDRGQRPATNRYRWLQQFFKWLLEEGEIKANPMANMRPPHVPKEPPEVLRLDELQALLATCDGTDFEERRDQAILRLFLDTGIRLAELAGLRAEDVDFEHNIAVVLGKGSRPRAVPFGRRTTRALPQRLPPTFRPRRGVQPIPRPPLRIVGRWRRGLLHRPLVTDWASPTSFQEAPSFAKIRCEQHGMDRIVAKHESPACASWPARGGAARGG